MNISRILAALTLSLLPVFSIGCGTGQSSDLNEALALYRENKLEQALPLFEKLVAQDQHNAEKLTWLAETYRRLGRKEQSVTTARQALECNPRSGFAHTIIAEALNPVMGEWEQANSDTTWSHLMQAIACDSNDGHPWLIVWGEAIHRGERSKTTMALRRLVETGFLTKAALSYGRWMLRGLPKRAILITNGDMDTYPPSAVQEVEGFRKDVVIVNRGTLNEDWYARFIRDEHGITLPFADTQLRQLRAFRDSSGNVIRPSDQIFRGWVGFKSKGSFNRPLAVAITVEEAYWSFTKEHMRFSGAFLQWGDEAMTHVPDTVSMIASITDVTADDFTGSWVSEQDRSPIRRMYTKNIVRNVTQTGIVSADALLKARRFSEARRWIDWAEELDTKAELGPVFSGKISQLRTRLAAEQR